MEDKIIFKSILKVIYGIVIIITFITSSFFIIEIYELEVERRRNTLLEDRIQNKLATHKFVEGIIHPLDKKTYTSPIRQIPCLVYWYYKTERYSYSNGNGRTTTSDRIIYDAKNRLPFEIRTKDNEIYKIFTKINLIKHDLSDNISPIKEGKQTHYELILKEGDLVSVLIKKDFDPALVKNEIFIYKDTKEAWLSKIRNRSNTKGYYIVIGIFLIIFIPVISIFYFIIRKLKSLINTQDSITS